MLHRIIAFQATVDLVRAVLQVHHERSGPPDVYVDIGCAEGFLSLEMQRILAPKTVHLVDISNRLLPHVPRQWLRLSDVEKSVTVKWLRQLRPNFVTCIHTLHEFKKPHDWVRDITSTLPIDGSALIVDRSERGWQQTEDGARQEGGHILEHLESDLENVDRHGLRVDADIILFWSRTRRELPVETTIEFHDGIYLVKLRRLR